MDWVRNIEFAQYGTTNVHPIAFVFLVIAGALTFAPKRSWAILAVLAVCVFMPMDQRVVIGGLDFSMVRLIMIVAWVRTLIRREYRGFKLGKLDWCAISWFVSASLFFVLREGSSATVYRLGVSFDQFTAFFLIRVLVRTPRDVWSVWKHLAWIVLVLGPPLIYEAVALHNVFGIFDYSGFEFVDVRNGRPRAQGPFSHPVLIGTFASAVIPVFVGIFLGWKDQRRLFGAACIAATTIVAAAGSSGPLVALGVGAFGWGIWRLRKRMRLLLGAATAMAIVIHFAREKPIWHLIGRLSSVTGGTGWHRYKLIDAFIRRFSEWALVGTNNTAHWGWGLQDTTNQYVAEGVSGGLVTLILFIVVLRISFKQLRLARNAFERIGGPKNRWALLAWGCSVSLAVHCVSFVSVSYFGEMNQLFYIFLATIPGLSAFKRPKRAKPARPSASANASTRNPGTRFSETTGRGAPPVFGSVLTR